MRLVCNEGQFDALLADLALHKLDVVLTDRPVRSGTHAARVQPPAARKRRPSWSAPPALAERLCRRISRAASTGAPFLLPTRNNALRGKIDEWFEQHNVRPDVVGEFEDNALLDTFGRRGAGLFFAPACAGGRHEGAVRRGAGRARCPQVREQFYAISNERKIAHPAVEAIMSAVHQGVLHSA